MAHYFRKLLSLTLVLLGLMLGRHPVLAQVEEPREPNWLGLVNTARGQAGVPPVTADAALSAQCWEHAHYMAENNHITHTQDPTRPYASASGDRCAHNGNVWLAPAYHKPFWDEQRTIADWLASPGHRLWLLYPTTSTFGFGFFTAANNRAGAALDVTSRAAFRSDQAYKGWPLRYPAPGQADVPAGRYPITLSWRYFGPLPQVDQMQLTVNGRSIPSTATTALPAEHKGVLIIPDIDIPPGATVTITVAGSYSGTSFVQTWSYATQP